MLLSEIQGSYHSIMSLGFNCTPSIQLEANRIRPFSGVLDWMVSANLTDVSRLMRNRFSGFFELSNLLQIDNIPNENNYIVHDVYYNMVSNHDFARGPYYSSFADTYWEVKEKFNRRIARVLHRMATDPKLLFVRLQGTYEEAVELQSVLMEQVAHDFRILLVNYTQTPAIVDLQWPLEKVCSVELPAFDMFSSSYDPNWNVLLQGISYINN